MSKDLISRQAAIDALDKEYRCTDQSDDWDGLKTAMLIIENLPSAQTEQRWIPVSERLPEKEGWYFVTVHPDYIIPDSMHTDSLYWLDGKWWFFDYDARTAVWLDPIIAWMPLPEPYKERREE